MSEELKIELSDAEFTLLCDLASKNGITLEEQAARIIEASFSERHSRQASEVSIVFLRDNVEAVLDAADRGPVYITTGTGREFVLLSKQEYDQILASE